MPFCVRRALNPGLTLDTLSQHDDNNTTTMSRMWTNARIFQISRPNLQTVSSSGILPIEVYLLEFLVIHTSDHHNNSSENDWNKGFLSCLWMCKSFRIQIGYVSRLVSCCKHLLSCTRHACADDTKMLI